MLLKSHYVEPSVWLYFYSEIMFCGDGFFQRKGAELSKVRKALRNSAFFATLRLYFAAGLAGLVLGIRSFA